MYLRTHPDRFEQRPTSSEISDSELYSQPCSVRRPGIIGLVSQILPLRWWFARHSRTPSEDDLSKIPVYPGA